MVVLSAKNNHSLAELFKASANYLVKSPQKLNKTLASNEKKKMNEDLIDEIGSRLLSDAKNIQKAKPVREKAPLKSISKPRLSVDSNKKCPLRLSQQKENQCEKPVQVESKETDGESTALKFVKRAQERQASRIKQREHNKEQVAPCLDSIQDRRQSTHLLATSVEKLNEIKYTNERLQKMKDVYKEKRQAQYFMQLNPESILDDTLRNMSQSFDQRLKHSTKHQKSSSKKPSKQTLTSILSERQIQTLQYDQVNSRQLGGGSGSSLKSNSIKVKHNQSLQNSGFKEKALSKSVVKQNHSQSFHYKAASTTVEIPRLNIQTPSIMEKPIYKTLDIEEETRKVSQENESVLSNENVKVEEQGESISEMMIKLMKIRQKIIKNQKEINFKTFIEFKRAQNPSLECQKAAKCLGKLLTIVSTPQSPPLQLVEWTDYKAYYLANSHKIVSEMSTFIQKSDIKQYNIDKVEALFKEVFYSTTQDLSTINSPKVKFNQYKSVLKYCYYTLCYILLNEKIQQLQKKQFDFKQKNSAKSKTEAKRKLNQTSVINHSSNIIVKKDQVRHSSVIKLRKNEDMPLKRTALDYNKTSLNQSLRVSLQGSCFPPSKSNVRQSQDWSLTNTTKLSPSKSSLAKSAQKQTKKCSMINSLKVSSRKDKDQSFIRKRSQNNSISNINQVYMTKQSLQQFDTLNYSSKNSSGEGSEKEIKQVVTQEEEEQDESEQQIIDLPALIDVEINTRNLCVLTQSSANQSIPIVSCFQNPAIISSKNRVNEQNQSQVDNMNQRQGGLINSKMSTDKMDIIQRLKEERLKSKERVQGSDLEKKTYQIIYDLTRDIKKSA